jgi:hypothetical protein
MAEQGIKIEERAGVFHLSGILNEYADFDALLAKAAPLKLNMRGVSRLNSIGIRNLLKFIGDWGAKPFEYIECPSEFVDQINMIPSLLGAKKTGKVVSLFVPYACENCDNEPEVLCPIGDFAGVAAGGEPAPRKCDKCQGKLTVLTDSFFVFLTR